MTADASILTSPAALPPGITDVGALDELLARPSEAVVADLAHVDGDILVLGAGGKMGPTLEIGRAHV